MSQLSPNFSEYEWLRSATATKYNIENIWEKKQYKENAIRLSSDYLELFREATGPITISSGYRSLALNKLVGGSRSSAHTVGLAVDMTFRINIYDAFDKIIKVIKDKKLEWDQLIFEEKVMNGVVVRWVHFGLSNGVQRKQILHRNIKGQYIPITKAPRGK